LAFLSKKALDSMGFKSLGNDVLISDKAAIYNPEDISIGHFSRIDDFCVVSGKVSIGRNVHIAVFCNVAGGTEGITLDDFAGLAYGVNLFTQSDDYSGITLTNPTVPDEYKIEIKKSIKVGKHSIIGTNAIVFPGVNIAEGTSVGAQSIMTKSSEPWSIYIGSPARKIKERKRDMLELEVAYLESEKTVKS
jgi:acetyltransferase-like isoleucine patch superfamily enzyme